MPLGTLDRTPPPFFKQGASAFSKLLLFSAMALFLMVADSRFHMTQPLRAVLATALYPVQWLAMQPVQALRAMGDYFISLESAKSESQEASTKLLSQALRASQVEQLTLENKRLRTLLDLREQLKVEGMAAEVLYDAADPYTRKVIISKGMTSGVALGSPVIDESGWSILWSVKSPSSLTVTWRFRCSMCVPAFAALLSAMPLAAVAWSCVSWAATQMFCKATCSLPAVWMAFTRPACRWPA